LRAANPASQRSPRRAFVDQIVCTDLRRYCAEYEGQFPKLLNGKFERHGHALDLAKLELHFADAVDLPYRDGRFDLATSVTRPSSS